MRLWAVGFLLVLAVADAALLCIDRTSATKCVPKVDQDGESRAFAHVFSVSEQLRKCTYIGSKTERYRRVTTEDCFPTQDFGCCCIAGFKKGLFDVCDGDKVSSLKVGETTDLIDTTPPMPDIIFKDFTKSLNWKEEAPGWMWDTVEPLHYDVLEFNPVMYFAPKSHLLDVLAYKLDYFTHLFIDSPFGIVIASLTRLYNAMSSLLEQEQVLTLDLLHHAVQSVYEGLKTYIFVTKLDKSLSPACITNVGDHVFADSLLPPKHQLERTTAVRYNPFQVHGHIDPNDNITRGKTVFKIFAKNAHLFKDIDDLFYDIIFVANIDCSAWGRLYDPQMRMFELSKEYIENLGQFIAKFIKQNLKELAKLMMK